jgi:poly(ADP-ribose) glycohydrolase
LININTYWEVESAIVRIFHGKTFYYVQDKSNLGFTGDMSHFILPSSQTVLVQDRLDILQSDLYEMPFWDILCAILRNQESPITDTSSFIEALETIAVTLRGTAADVDYGFLRNFLTECIDAKDFFKTTWPVLIRLALEMPTLFPEDALQDLGKDGKAVLSGKQIACLVVHQFLCSMPAHPWETESFVDFRPWYSEHSTQHCGAVTAYLTALFTYFQRLREFEQAEIWRLAGDFNDRSVTFELKTISNQEAFDLLSTRAAETSLLQTSLELIFMPRFQISPRYLGLSHGCCVISANKCVGYGPSGTQEELQVGTSPECYPIVLLAPPLADNQVLICRGAEAMLTIHGYGREARLDRILTAGADLEWKNRTMLFMDALELDILPVEYDSLIPDIYPSWRMERDMLLKAFNAFSSSESGNYSHVVTGLWGCGTFGGNKYVKSMLQWCAAALAGVPVMRMVLAETEEQKSFGEELKKLDSKLRENKEIVSVKQMFDILLELKGSIRHVGAENGIFDFILDNTNSGGLSASLLGQ